MIERIRIGIDMLDAKRSFNPWERESWVKILCATNTVWRSEDMRSISWQVEKRFDVPFQHEKSWRYIWNLWDIFETWQFNFWKQVKASAHAIVCHLGGDMSDQNYTTAREGLDIGLEKIHHQIAESDPIRNSAILREYDDWLEPMNLTNPELSLRQHESLIKSIRLKLNPLMRIPLMASGSPEDCARLFEIMEKSRANLVVYMLIDARDLVEATIIQFPQLKQTIPALTDEELQLAA